MAPARREALQAALDSQRYEDHTGLGLMLADMVARAHGGGVRLPPSAARLRDRAVTCRHDSEASDDSSFKSRGGLRRIWQAVRYSLAGLRAALRHEAAFRQELALGLPMMLAAPWLAPRPLGRAGDDRQRRCWCGSSSC